MGDRYSFPDPRDKGRNIYRQRATTCKIMSQGPDAERRGGAEESNLGQVQRMRGGSGYPLEWWRMRAHSRECDGGACAVYGTAV